MDYNKIIELVRQAGQFVFDPALRSHVHTKGAADFVTAVDLQISRFLQEQLAVHTPDIGFMSEEEESTFTDTCWILDPIDGTTNLVYDYNLSSVSLALLQKGQVVFGVIYNPFNGDLFTAERGKGAFLNGQKLEAAPDRDLKDCLIEFGAGSTFKQYADGVFAMGKEIFETCLDLRRMCSSALAIAYVAAGKINGYFEPVLKPWDYAAAVLMLEETGCCCADWAGQPVPFDRPSSFVCGTPKAHAYLLETIAKHRK